MTTARTDAAIRHFFQAALRQDDAAQPDAHLLTAFLDRQDEAAFAALVRRYGPMVFGICRRIVGNHHDAEDAFQATFLVLARKASTVRPREQLASWLHGVALCTALKARSLAARRRGRERQVADMPEPEVAAHDPWRDLQPLLDQELNGLPANYRLPILLCDLEGKAIKEAARQLGWPQGTLAGRLARGRKLLARRLANRGVALPAAALAAVVLQNGAPAAVPTALQTATAQAAAALAAGRAMVAGVVPARVAILTEGVLKAMLLSKLKSARVAFLVVAVALGATVATYRTPAAEQPKNGAPAGGFPPPPRLASQREYVLVAKLAEAGADHPIELPKVVAFESQLVHVVIPDNPRNLLEKVVVDEKIKIGTFLDCRAKYLDDNRVRLVLSFERNELDKSDVSEIRVLGHSVQAIQDVELHKPVKVVFQKDARGEPQRWLECTVELVASPAAVPPPPAVAPPLRERGKK